MAAFERYPAVAESPSQPDAGLARVQGAGRNASTGGSFVPRGTARPACDSLAGTTEGPRYPPRAHDDAVPGLPASLPDSRVGRVYEALCSAAGVKETVTAAGDVALAAGGLEGCDDGDFAGASISKDDYGREPLAEENEGVDDAPDKDA